ncbi:methyltransferase [uncultured Bacteroides sp.]|uniref:tRNA1(Val) (adenine(37)-N6)-methyltransferase n=1 Tax=uncultured Bacteroides sp. TaxID=162156 RepID=UPI00261F29AD|nr:methyltransferase [uncultured Bacteroides sp.]
MPNPFFKFKKFTVYHDRCAMKVGTDGVLLGAWAKVEGAHSILDIGTGTGLIALMLAQRNQEASVLGIDIDEGAVLQACENVSRSPWGDRINIEKIDVCELGLKGEGRFDCIVSNPPYFQENVHCPDEQRNQARHTAGLSFEALLDAVDRLLNDEGEFSVVLPNVAASQFISLAASRFLYLRHRTLIHTKPGAEPKRVLLAFGRKMQMSITDHLTIELERHVYSEDYITLTRDFYLFM